MKLGLGALLLARLRMICALIAMMMLGVAALQPPMSAAGVERMRLPVDNILLRHVLNPEAGVLLICAGWLLICVEFCQPGRFLPGGVGVLAISLGGYSVGELMGNGLGFAVHAAGWVGIAVTAALTATLFAVAGMARRLKFRPDGAATGWKTN